MKEAILVASCRNYSDAWHPFITLLRKFWKPCPYPVILVTDEYDERLQCSLEFDSIYRVGRDHGWVRNFDQAIRSLNVERFLFMQEDYFLNAPVKDYLIKQAFKMVAEYKTNCVRIYPCPGPDKPYDNDFGICEQGAPYRVSCQAAVWDSEFWKYIGKMAHHGTPASFEIDGTVQLNTRSVRIDHPTLLLPPHEPVFSVYRDKSYPMSYYCSAITRGAWEPDALKFCTDQGIVVDTSRRPIR